MMNDLNNTNDNLDMNDYQKESLPGGLNVLTILTFIGCAIGILGALWSFIQAKSAFDNKEKVMEQMNSGNMPGWAKSMMPDPAHFELMVNKSYENRIPILLLSVIAVGLCFAGAMQMRKRKKQGYLLYVIGELLPFLTIIFFLGTFALTGASGIFTIVLALLFILLYTMQRKNLIY